MRERGVNCNVTSMLTQQGIPQHHVQYQLYKTYMWTEKSFSSIGADLQVTVIFIFLPVYDLN